MSTGCKNVSGFSAEFVELGNKRTKKVVRGSNFVNDTSHVHVGIKTGSDFKASWRAKSFQPFAVRHLAVSLGVAVPGCQMTRSSEAELQMRPSMGCCNVCMQPVGVAGSCASLMCEPECMGLIKEASRTAVLPAAAKAHFAKFNNAVGKSIATGVDTSDDEDTLDEDDENKQHSSTRPNVNTDSKSNCKKRNARPAAALQGHKAKQKNTKAPTPGNLMTF